MALVPGLVSGIKHSSLISEEGELEPTGLCVILRNYRIGSVDYSSVLPFSPASVQVDVGNVLT